MPNRDDLLRDETHKGDVEDLQQRIYYTLHRYADVDREPAPREAADVAIAADRTSRAVGALIDELARKGLLEEDAIDRILLAARGHRG